MDKKLNAVDFTNNQRSVIIDTPHVNLKEDLEMFCLGVQEKIIHLPEGSDMADVLVAAGLFQSKSQARKNWKATPTMEIPKGWAEWTVGKFKVSLAVWNPQTDSKDFVEV